MFNGEKPLKAKDAWQATATEETIDQNKKIGKI